MVVYTNAGGGGGTPSDELTAVCGDVLKGKTAVTSDSNDEAIAGTLELTGDAADSHVLAEKTYYNTEAKTKRRGTMANLGAVSQALNAGENYTIPTGYHNGSGRVTANSLASQTGGATAGDGDVLSGKTYWKDGAKRTGTMANRNNVADNGSVRLLVEDGKVKMYPQPGYYGGYTDGGPYYVWDPQTLVAERGGLTAAKILQGQTAFGISGTATNDAVLDPQYLLKGYSGYDDGVKKAGTMVDHGGVTAALNCGSSYTIPKGHHNGSGRVTANSLASQTSANASPNDIRSGKTAWVNGAMRTGTLAVQSAISFSAAALSYDKIRISWKNPAKGPWQGVFIQMSTSGYPGTGGGSRAYTGTGTNPNQAGGNNYVDIGGLSPGTTYYFTCTSYCDAFGWGTSHNVNYRTSDPLSIGQMVTAGWFYNVLPLVFNSYFYGGSSDDPDAGYCIFYMNRSNNVNVYSENAMYGGPFFHSDNIVHCGYSNSQDLSSVFTFFVNSDENANAVVSSIKSRYAKIRFELRSRNNISSIASMYTKELTIKTVTNKGLCGNINYQMRYGVKSYYNFSNDSRFKNYYVVEIQSMEGTRVRTNDSSAYYYVLYFYK